MDVDDRDDGSGWASTIEAQRRADLCDGTYRNPIVGGDHPDPNVLRDGDDYYAIFSTFQYYPGAVIWRSRDLLNWTVVGPALTKPIGPLLALDITKHDGRFFVYIPAVDASLYRPDARHVLPIRIWAVHADRIEGPWSDPVDLGIVGRFDPGHAVSEDGRRYLFLDDGHRVRLTADGLAADGPVEKVYDGWVYPEEWIDAGFGLEGPKVVRRGDWFYLFSAEGGTAGPPTSHMVVVARSRSIDGPWENAPGNPIVRTVDRDEPWWSRGHATPVEGPDGRWWLVYHGYENGLRSLGRQMLMEPLHWTDDGWPFAGSDLRDPLPAPVPTPTGDAHGLPLSGPFDARDIGRRLVYFDPKPGYLDRAKFDGGAMTLAGQGGGPADSAPLALIPPDRAYKVSVEVELDGDVEAGLLLFYSAKLFCGVGVTPDGIALYAKGSREHLPIERPFTGNRVHLRVVNDEEIASFLWSTDGGHWQRLRSLDVSGYQHNIGDGFISLRPALFAARAGHAGFRDLRYAARPLG